MQSGVYRRGQVEWALWRWALAWRMGPAEPPPRFLARVNKLLELDRRGEPLASEVEHALYAFLERAPAGRGTDLQLTAFDAFCLALGLDLMAFGFKQQEVVFLMRHIRGELRTWFDAALVAPPSRQRQLPGTHLDVPTYTDDQGRVFEDLRIFMVLGRIETTDMLIEGESVLRQPVFCRGVTELSRELRKLDLQRRQAHVTEIAWSASFLAEALPQAPVIKRGRP